MTFDTLIPCTNILTFSRLQIPFEQPADCEFGTKDEDSWPWFHHPWRVAECGHIAACV